jgi:hypothetical protein
MKKLFSKKRKKTEGDSPEKYNALYSFNYESIIKQSKTTDNPLSGSESSDTLFIKTEINKISSGLIFTEHYGIEIIKALNKQIKDKFPSSFLISRSNISQDLAANIPSLEIPTLELLENTFSRGIAWFDDNKEKITHELNKQFRDTSLIFIFVENDAFTIGLITKIVEYLKEKNQQPILSFHIPPHGIEIIREFNVLTAIHKLMKESTDIDVPFILYDENSLAKANPNEDLDILKSKLYDREAHIIADLLIASQTPSEFYHVDISNFLRVFKETKGPCLIYSVDVYDNNPILSKLLENSNFAWNFITEHQSTRGFLVIQPGNQGLMTKEYQKIRKIYSNLDVIFSILPKRTSGALIRGIFTSNMLPKQILSKYNLFSKIFVETYSENKESIGIVDLSDLDAIWEKTHYLIKVRAENGEN